MVENHYFLMCKLNIRMFRVEIVKERSDLFFRLKDKETIINITPIERRFKGTRTVS